jgi:hypothetical protein
LFFFKRYTHPVVLWTPQVFEPLEVRPIGGSEKGHSIIISPLTMQEFDIWQTGCHILTDF